MSQGQPRDKDEIMYEAAKKSGKQILSGLSKAGMLFTKRMAEGAFNAQIRQSREEETAGKLKAAGQELGKAFLKGAVEGGSVGVTTLIEGVNSFSKEIGKYSQPDPDQLNEDDDYEVNDQ